MNNLHLTIDAKDWLLTADDALDKLGDRYKSLGLDTYETEWMRGALARHRTCLNRRIWQETQRETMTRDNLQKVYAHLDLAANALTNALAVYTGDEGDLRACLAELRGAADNLACLVEHQIAVPKPAPATADPDP